MTTESARENEEFVFLHTARTVRTFNFRKHWSKLIPFLGKETVQGALANCCFDWAYSWGTGAEPENPERAAWMIFSRHYEREGPWNWTSSDAACTMMDARIENSGELPEVFCEEDMEKESYWQAHNDLYDELSPKPNEVEFYQMPHGCHFIVLWVEEIIKLAFPKLEVETLPGEDHSVVIGTSPTGAITVFDIRFFETMTGRESLKWVEIGEEKKQQLRTHGVNG